MIRFKATDEQLRRISLLAINASIPMGVGLLHYQNKHYTMDDIKKSLSFENGVIIDYFEGRMVKLYIVSLGNGWYSVENDIDIMRQSFKRSYADMKALIARVEGIEAFEVQEPVE